MNLPEAITKVAPLITHAKARAFRTRDNAKYCDSGDARRAEEAEAKADDATAEALELIVREAGAAQTLRDLLKAEPITFFLSFLGETKEVTVTTTGFPTWHDDLLAVRLSALEMLADRLGTGAQTRQELSDAATKEHPVVKERHAYVAARDEADAKHLRAIVDWLRGFQAFRDALLRLPLPIHPVHRPGDPVPAATTA